MAFYRFHSGRGAGADRVSARIFNRPSDHRGPFARLTGAKASTFDVAIQLGSILAVVVLYWRRFMGLLYPGRIHTDSPTPFAGLRGIGLLILTTLPPSIVGLLLHSRIKMLFSPGYVAGLWRWGRCSCCSWSIAAVGLRLAIRRLTR